MWPDFEFLKGFAAFEFPVDFTPYLKNGNITQDEFNQLTQLNKQAQFPANNGGENGDVD
ncbi:hypothetical protein AKUG0406_PHAGE200500 (plasmid) [Apilactobacillus kunkeei]|nr:hypothetical protein AKUG0406_PHAGE200500 [Apilactobacillus kunkeei]CAI2678505.1 hypothetical protein AKUG0403_PHAGE200510 [Apilactobacillus kunkeei]CAI2681516.1 hypothetical protein AKUG0420_PHAGE200510 [Apilactobacillus kunkeei]